MTTTKTIKTPSDKTVSDATAFRTWSDLQLAFCRGYTPSLRRTNPAQRKLGRELERIGARVFWG